MNTLKKIFVISGRSQAGKDTTADYIKDYYKDLKTIKLQFSSYIKMYAKEISTWDQKENDKPRELLQDLGEQIRMNVDKFFFINRIVEDIKVYQDYFDIVTICDARLPDELDTIKNEFNNVYSTELIQSTIFCDLDTINLRLAGQDKPMCLNYKYGIFDVFHALLWNMPYWPVCNFFYIYDIFSTDYWGVNLNTPIILLWITII